MTCCHYLLGTAISFLVIQSGFSSLVRGDVVAEIRLVDAPHLVGEVISFDVMVRNQSSEPRRIAKLQDGYRSRLVRVELIGPDGSPVPPPLLPEPAVQRATDWQTLPPDARDLWSSADTRLICLSPVRAGQHILKISVPTSEKASIQIEKRFDVLNRPEKKDVLSQVAVTFKGAEWAGTDDRGVVEAIKFERQCWLYYRRLNRNGEIFIRRVGQLNDAAQFIVAGDQNFVEVAWIDPLGKLQTARLGSQDGWSVR
jgi:hypothetical protein